MPRKYRSMLETMHLFGKGEHAAGQGGGSREFAGRRETARRASASRTTRSSWRSTGPTSDLEIPTGDTMLRAGDTMIVIVKNGAAERIRAMLGVED